MRLRLALAVLATTVLCAWAQEKTEGTNPFRRKVALIAGFAEDSATAASVKKFAAGFAESHPDRFAFASKVRPGEDRFRVLTASGEVAYEGPDDKQAETAVVNALTDLPVPGAFVTGVEWKHFKALRKKFVRLGKPAEGMALTPFKNGLKSKKPGVAEEAQAVLDAIAKRHDSLIREIEDEEKDAPAEAYRDMLYFSQTWPSEKAKYAERLKELSANAETMAAYRKLMTPPKRK